MAKKKETIEESKTYYLLDTHDRVFDEDGIYLVLEANVRQEVTKKVADTLKKKYPYLQVVTE